MYRPMRIHTPTNNPTNGFVLTLLFIIVQLRLSLSNEELETGLLAERIQRFQMIDVRQRIQLE